MLIEDSNAGKTSVIVVIVGYIENKFEASGISTLGVDIKFKFVSFDNIKTKFIDIRNLVQYSQASFSTNLSYASIIKNNSTECMKQNNK